MFKQEAGPASSALVSRRCLRECMTPGRGSSPTQRARGAGVLEHDLEHPHTLRYTINTLARPPTRSTHGDQRVAFLGGTERDGRPLPRPPPRRRDRPGGPGSFPSAARRGQPRCIAPETIAARVGAASRGSAGRGLARSRICAGCCGGASVAARSGVARAERSPTSLFRARRRHLRRPGLRCSPAIALGRYRSRIVSFGATVYFLRAVYEYACPHRVDLPRRAAVRARRGGDPEDPGAQGEWP